MSSARPALSAIIPWRNRTELGDALRRNDASFVAEDVEVVIANCGGKRSAIADYTQGLRARVRIVHIPMRTFNKCFAQNLGAVAAKGKALMLLDADIVLPSGFLRAAISAVRRGFYVTVDRLVEEIRRGPLASAVAEVSHQFKLTTATGRRATVELNRVCPTERTRRAPGLVLVRREDFLGVRGMNATFRGWGWEDIDLLVRLQLVRNLRPRSTGRALHLGGQSRITAAEITARAKSERLNYTRALGRYGSGNFFGTLEEDAVHYPSCDVYEAG